MGWLLGVYAVAALLILIGLVVAWSDWQARKQRQKHAH